MSSYFAKINVQAVPGVAPMFYDGAPLVEPVTDVLSFMGWQFKPHPEVLNPDGTVADPGGPYESGNPKWNVRNYIVAPPGMLLFNPDYSGQELVVQANLSGDPLMVETLGRGDDLHKVMAETMWGKEKYNKNRRKVAKGCRFRFQYGGSAWAMNKAMPEFSLEECYDQWERYWVGHGATSVIVDERRGFEGTVKHLVPLNGNGALPDFIRKLEARNAKYWVKEVNGEKGLVKWNRDNQIEAERKGFLKSIGGRVHRVGYWYSQFKYRSFADRTVLNRPIQGACGDILRYVLVRVQKEIIRRKEWCDLIKHSLVRWVWTVHDEFCWAVTEREPLFTDIVTELERVMTDLKVFPQLSKVPLQIDKAFGRRLGQTFKFERKGSLWVPKKR